MDKLGFSFVGPILQIQLEHLVDKDRTKFKCKHHCFSVGLQIRRKFILDYASRPYVLRRIYFGAFVPEASLKRDFVVKTKKKALSSSLRNIDPKPPSPFVIYIYIKQNQKISVRRVVLCIYVFASAIYCYNACQQVPRFVDFTDCSFSCFT